MKQLPRIFVIFCVCSSLFSNAQSDQCDYWPAPCPHKSEISNARDWTVAKNNGRLPQEMVFEETLKSKTEKIVNAIAQRNNWQVYEFNESSFNTPLTANEKGIVDTVPFEKRPPHVYIISYIFITSPSIMKQWIDWLEDFRDRADKSFTSITAAPQPNERQKSYYDSAMYYTNLGLKYMQSHQAEYNKAIKAGDDKYLKRYEAETEAYRKRSDSFIDKYNELQKEASAGPEQKWKQLQEEETSKNIYYRDGSTLLVKFSFNEPRIGSGIVDPTNDRNIQPQKYLNIPQFQFSAVTHNPLPAEHVTTEESKGIADFDFEHPSYVGLVLVDGWNLQHGNVYQADFARNAVNNGYKTKKPVTTDHLRSIAIHIEGGQSSVVNFMQQLSVQELKAMVIQ